MLTETWPEVYASRQTRNPLRWTVTGVEEHNDSLCLVVSQDRTKGIIPLEQSGINLIGDDRTIKGRVMGLIGQPVSFIVTQIDKENSLFTGDRALAMEKQANKTWENLKPGQTRSVIVRRIIRRRNNKGNLVEIGIVVELDGIEAFIPVSELSHGWVETIDTIVQPGDIIDTYVQEVDQEKQKVFLSVKELYENPWPSCADRFIKNSVYVGTVTGMADYGIFVDLEPGVNALCRHMKSGRVNKGDQVAIAIISINPEEQKIFGAITRLIRKGA